MSQYWNACNKEHNVLITRNITNYVKMDLFNNRRFKLFSLKVILRKSQWIFLNQIFERNDIPEYIVYEIYGKNANMENISNFISI